MLHQSARAYVCSSNYIINVGRFPIANPEINETMTQLMADLDAAEGRRLSVALLGGIGPVSRLSRRGGGSVIILVC